MSAFRPVAIVLPMVFLILCDARSGCIVTGQRYGYASA